MMVTVRLTARSRKDPHAAQPAISTWSEARMASVRRRLVCGMYDLDHWQFVEGWYPYVAVQLVSD
jgi:hypothetical protein